MSDHYQILGVARDADPIEINKAYKKLATQYHPDKVECLGPKIKDFAVNEMRRINEARDTLSDPKRKETYDRTLNSPAQVRPPQQPPVNRYNFKCPHCKGSVAAIPMERPYVINCSSCRGAMTIPAMNNGMVYNVPVTRDGPKPPEKISIYREAVRRALIDGVITNDEMSILDGLRTIMGINPMEHQQTILMVQASMGR
jgi:hypothetical protein